jgi:excisionase family DNA binding protein
MARKETLFKSREVAFILDCSPDDVAVLAKGGKLKAIRIGHYWKFRLSDVEAYKRAQRSK